ncbi:NADH-quinone oxidoreductase subunit C [bacterium]|nr:NADH-quinone oxidoreductase subunit C [bacterium]
MTRDELNAKLKEDLATLAGDKAISLEMNYGMLVLTIPAELHHKVAEWAYNDEFWQFNHFIDITAVDYLKLHDDYRFELVVHLRSHKHNLKFRYKTRLAGDDPSIATLTDVYAGASWTEREIWDFFGINFTGHPRMTRILSPDDFVGYPLRKDFPVKGQHRGTFPRGTVVSNKRREAVTSPQTKPKPADQMLPRTPWEIRREPLRGKENGNA